MPLRLLPLFGMLVGLNGKIRQSNVKTKKTQDFIIDVLHSLCIHIHICLCHMLAHFSYVSAFYAIFPFNC